MEPVFFFFFFFLVPLPFIAARLIIPNNVFRMHERFPRNVRTLIVAGDLTLYETEELWYDSGEEGPEHDRWNEMFLYCNLRQQFYQWRNATPHFRSLEVTHHPKGNDMDGNSKPILEQLCDEERVLVSLTMEASPLVSGPSD